MKGVAAKESTLLTTVGFLEQPLMGGKRRLGADNAALAFEAFEQVVFFAADIGAGAHSKLDVETMVRALDIGAEPAGAAGQPAEPH